MDRNTSLNNFLLSVYDDDKLVSKYVLSDFNKSKVTIGGGSSNDIALPGNCNSDLCGMLKLTSEGWKILSGDTDKGIEINGSVKTESDISNGTKIKINNCTLVFSSVLGVSKQMNKSKSLLPDNKMPKPVIITIFLCGVALLCILCWFILSSVFSSGEIEPTDDKRSRDFSVVYSEGMSYAVPTEPVDVAVPDILPATDGSKQLLLVNTDGSYADLTFYEMQDNNWVEQFTARGRCGANGITQSKRDGDGCTPAGEYELNFCLGLSKPETRLDFEWVDTNTVWVDDAQSDYYNTIQQGSGDWSSAEYIYDDYFSNKSHNYLINIAANGDGLTPGDADSGKGSGITLCGKNGTLDATYGCIDISSQDMLTLLSYLDSEKNPVIIIY